MKSTNSLNLVALILRPTLVAVKSFSYVNTSQERTKSIIHSVTLYLHECGLNLDTIHWLLSIGLCIISMLLSYMCTMPLNETSSLFMFKYNSENIWTLLHASFAFYKSSYCSFKVLSKWISHSDSLATAVKRSRTPLRSALL